MRYVESSGFIEKLYPMTDYMGVRPAFYLDTEYYVATSGDGTKANPYVGSAPDKVESDYTVAEPDDDPNQEWDINIEQNSSLPSDRITQTTANMLIRQSQFIPFKKQEAISRIW